MNDNLGRQESRKELGFQQLWDDQQQMRLEEIRNLQKQIKKLCKQVKKARQHREQMDAVRFLERQARRRENEEYQPSAFGLEYTPDMIRFLRKKKKW